MHVRDEIPNQDSSFVLHTPDDQPNLFRRRSATERRGVRGLFAIGVFDGHGPRGHEASILAAERMKFALSRISSDRTDLTLEDVVKQAFRETAASLDSAPCSADSGTTGSVAVVRDDDVVVANVGDSTIYCVCRERWSRRPRTCYISPMHRPSDPAEAERVKTCGGRIQNDYVVDEHAKQVSQCPYCSIGSSSTLQVANALFCNISCCDLVQGIAVTRTMGDRDMKEYGCISDPAVHSFKLRRRDCAIVVASDGLWDVPELDEEGAIFEAINGFGIVPRMVCNRLHKIASHQGSPTDDCTIACMMFL